MTKKRTSWAVFIVVLALVGCAGYPVVKSPLELSSQEQAALALTLYNNAFANYHAQFAATPRPMAPAAIDYFKAYKKVMETAWPVISSFTAVVQIGQSPTTDQEAELVRMIYQLQAMLISKEG